MIEMRILGDSFQNIQKFVPDQIIKELNLNIKEEDALKKLIRYLELGVINKANKINMIFILKMLEDVMDTAESLEAV